MRNFVNIIINRSVLSRDWLAFFSTANPKRDPLLLIFQAMLNTAPVVQLIKALRLDEHLLAFQQTGQPALAWLGALLAFDI